MVDWSGRYTLKEGISIWPFGSSLLVLFLRDDGHECMNECLPFFISCISPQFYMHVSRVLLLILLLDLDSRVNKDTVTLLVS